MGPAYKGTLAATSRGCSITTCTAALGEAADGGRCSGDRCSIPSAVSPPLPINVGAINGCSGCIDAWNTNLWSATTTNQPLKWCHNYHPFLPGIAKPSGRVY